MILSAEPIEILMQLPVWLVCLSFTCLGGYLAALLIDLRVVAKELRALLQAGKGAKVEVDLGQQQRLTSVGAWLIRQLEALRYRFSTQQWQLESASDSAGAASLPILEPVEVPASDQPEAESGEAALITQMLDERRTSFRAQGAAVIFGGSAAELSVVGLGVGGALFKQQLQDFTNPFFEGNATHCVGRRDGYEARGVFGDFAVLGFRYTVCQPFNFIYRDENCKGILWLGYVENRPPLEIEERRAWALAQQLGARLTSYFRLEKFSAKAKQAESLNRQRNELIAHMSHDLRSPLGNIRSILSLFKLEGVRDDTQDLLDVALKNCTSLAELVDDLLDYSRHSLGQLKSNPKDFVVNELLADVFEEYRAAAKIKGLNFKLNVPQEELSGCADLNQIRRVVSNLISNAIKYTKYGSVEVSLQALNKRCLITVTDTGAGISAEHQLRLFTPFTRFHEGLAEGIGLGLTLSKVLLELNGGSLSVKSKEACGSSFSIDLPLFHVQRDESCVEAKRFVEKRAPKVLLVDDQVDALEALGRALELNGYEIQRAATIADAVGLINFEEPGAIISDDYMPDGGARRVLNFLKDTNRQIPLLVLTGHDDVSEPLMALGAERVMQKPADMAELLDWLKSCCCAPENSETASAERFEAAA